MHPCVLAVAEALRNLAAERCAAFQLPALAHVGGGDPLKMRRKC